MGRPVWQLRIEGFVVFAVALVEYESLDGSWLLLAVLLFLPALSMIGYIGGPHVGAYVPSTFHTYSYPLAMAALEWSTAVGC
jgi:hypothetical protein